MSKESEKCQHIALLPERPTDIELIEIKKSIRKIKQPKINDGDHGGHPDLGFFTVLLEEDILIEWNLKNEPTKKKKFADFCDHADHEMDRLRLGWLIGNIFTLNKLHAIEDFGAPRGESGLEEFARFTNWYEKQEKIWYKWAVAKRVY